MTPEKRTDREQMEKKVAEEYDLPRKEDGTYFDWGAIEGWLFRDLVTARLESHEKELREAFEAGAEWGTTGLVNWRAFSERPDAFAAFLALKEKL
jgi:hypothetical protein